MNCEEVAQYIDDYVYHLLTEEMSKEIEEHIRSCPRCQRRLAGSERFKEILSAWQPIRQTGGLAQRVIEAAAARRRSPLVRYAKLAAIAASLLLITVLIFVFTTGDHTGVRSYRGQTQLFASGTIKPGGCLVKEILFKATDKAPRIIIYIKKVAPSGEATFRISLNSQEFDTVELPPGTEENRLPLDITDQLAPGKNKLVIEVRGSSPVYYEIHKRDK